MHEKCKNWTGALITGNPDLAKVVDLKEENRFPFFNGPIDCRLFIYDTCELKKGKFENNDEEADEAVGRKDC